jgi:hypothetical protein
LIETNYVIETLKIEQKSDLVFDAWNEVACLNDTAPYFSWTNQHSAFQNNFYRVRYALGTNHYNGSLQALIIIPDPPPDPDPDPGGSGHCDAGEGEGEPSTEEPIDLGTVMVSGTLGDHSSSASEAYALTLVATNDTHSYSSPLGSMGAFSFLLKRGRTYRLTLAHADSNNFKECDCCDNPQSCCYDYGCGGVYCEDCPCTCNPDRKNRTKLVMVYRDTPRTANIKLLQGGGFPDGHPAWSGSGTSGTTLHASGGLALKNKKLVACGSVGASDFTVGVTGEALFFNERYPVNASYVFDYEVNKDFESCIYDFN